MTVRALLAAQLRWGRRRLPVLVLVLVVLPGAVAGSSLLFADVLPRDAPVAVVGAADATDEDRSLATGAIRLFAHPVAFDDEATAFRALERERVYAVVVVPGGLTGEGSATLDMYVDGRLVPYREPSGAVASAVGTTLDRNLEADVGVAHHVRGGRPDLAAYLVPTFLFALLGVLAFVYLPYVLAREAAVLDRVRVTSSLEAYLGATLLFFGTLAAVPVAVVGAVAGGLGYPVSLLTPAAVGVALATFLAFAATGAAVTFLTGFGTAGRLANVLVLFAVLGLSGVAYPAGFFSPVRRELVRLVPTHYAAVLLRGTTMKGHGVTTDPTATTILVGTLVATLLLAELSLVAFRRRAR